MVMVVTNEPMPVRGNPEGRRRPGSPPAVALRASNWARAVLLSWWPAITHSRTPAIWNLTI
eukprot:2159918-Rhodomonas_salina.1